MSAKKRAVRFAGVIASCLLLSLSAGFAWSVVDDYTAREIVPAGVSVAGHDLGGLNREQAREVIESNVSEPLLREVSVMFQGETYEFDPAASLSIDVDGMLEEAFDPKTSTTLAERTYRRIADMPISAQIETRLSVEGTSIEEWVHDTAAMIDTPPVDAAFFIESDAVVMRGSSVGYKTAENTAVRDITQALLDGTKVVELPVDELNPAVSEDSLGQTLHVDLSERKVYLYEGTQLVKSYGVAIGTPSHPTPRGTYEVTLKRYMPTWSNPGSAWAANMPAYIPPGVSNPLGTRAINISASGIRFHGTTSDWSIGRAASHGCMRMHRWDVEDLFEYVVVGARVLIVS